MVGNLARKTIFRALLGRSFDESCR